VRDKAAVSPDYLLTIDDVLKWERRFGQVASGSVLLLYTGWQDKWASPKEFFGQDIEEVLHFPGFGIEAVRFLLEERGIAGIGIDTHGVDGGQDDTFAVNRLMLEQPRIVLENLTNLDQLPPTGATLVIGILRLKGGSGSPVSALAFVA
jgi:kynurenine formamidase